MDACWSSVFSFTSLGRGRGNSATGEGDETLVMGPLGVSGDETDIISG